MKENDQKLWNSAKDILRGKFIIIQAYLKIRKFANEQSKLAPKGNVKRRTNKTKS